MKTSLPEDRIQVCINTLGAASPAALSVCLLPVCLHTYLSVCLPTCLFAYLSFCLSTCLSAYLCICLPVRLCRTYTVESVLNANYLAILSVCLSTCLLAFQPAYLCFLVCLSAGLFLPFLFVCLPICLPACLTVCLFLCLCTCLST